MSEKTPAEAVKEMGADVTKGDVRSNVWNYLEENDLVDFPRPVKRRIPNFKGAATAADMVPTMEPFKKAQTVKINPDKPQEQARFLTLEANKNLMVPTPRLRTGLFNKIQPPADATKEILRICSTSQGVREYSKPVSLEDKVKMDLVIVGSVAVSKSGCRIGKGEGFADLEWAMMCAMGAVSKDTVVITTVHDCQVIDFPDSLMEEHDLVVDFIVTPTEIIPCNPTRSKPTGIIWSKLTPNKLRRVPILKKLMEMEKDAGKDVTLKEGADPDEADDKENEDGEYDRRRRGFRRGYRGGGAGADGGRADGGRGGYRRGTGRTYGRRPRGRDEDGEREGAGDAGRRDEEPEGEGDDKRRPRYRRYRRRPGPRRPKSESEGEGEGREGREGRNDDRGNDSEEGSQNRRRMQRKGRPRRGRQPSVFVGGLPRSLRVSEFKAKVRGNSVEPLRVIWKGGNGHAFLQFENSDLMESALDALAALDINGKKLRVEQAYSGRPPRSRSEDVEGEGSHNPNGDASQEERQEAA